ncbi:MAG: hypothetical protein QF511_09795 [Rhodospirillales bacterium]|jgi:hypothetical protein|nr:hypothetical protein [Rhodospirillales bacterium]MDP7215519.1 hypothetical protein [Rhodospirillales bacterium]HIJ46002.1 hypothetical protein [Rhodospirillaceae bacterium]HIJ92203.1 hypothetical protein [Rhodospirillaceae bacterium]HJP54352.1 hypothetical protein [Rhodospirillales bacterium]
MDEDSPESLQKFLLASIHENLPGRHDANVWKTFSSIWIISRLAGASPLPLNPVFGEVVITLGEGSKAV